MADPNDTNLPSLSISPRNQKLIEFASNQVLNRYDFDKIVNLIGPPTREAVQAAIEDAVDEINSTGPETQFTLEWIITGPDTRWRRYLYMAAAKNIMTQMSVKFTTDSYSIDIGELQVQDRLPEIMTMANELQSRFNDEITELKLTSQRFVRGSKGNGSYPTIRFSRSFATHRWGQKSFFSR